MNRFTKRRVRLFPRPVTAHEAMTGVGRAGAVVGTMLGPQDMHPALAMLAGCMVGGATGVVTGGMLHLLVRRPAHFAVATLGTAAFAMVCPVDFGVFFSKRSHGTFPY
jgi:hypothetical protein